MVTISRPTFAAHWSAIHDSRDWEMEERIARHMYSKPNDWSSNPSGFTTTAWHHYLSLRLWAHGRTSDLAQYCLDVAHGQAQEAEKVNTFEREPIPGSFPRNRFDYLVAKVFIDGVVNRTPLDRTAVLQIANDASVIAPAYSRREWDGAPQSDYLHTVDLLLLVDAREEAQAMVDSARSMRALNIKELFEIDKLILKSSTPVQDDVTAKQTYRRIFDLLRDPTYPDGLRGHPSNLYQGLIMACMWQKFFEPGDGHYDYDKAIDLLWE